MPISKRNRRGISLLIILGVSIAFTPRVLLAVFAAEKPTVSFSELKKAETVLLEKRVFQEKKKKTIANKKRKSRYSIPKSKFDPNQYKVEDWTKLGLSEKQAVVVAKFAQRGVKSNDDLRKIFVLPEVLFDLIEDSTYYPDAIGYVRERDALTKKDKELLYVPINNASNEMLLEIPGIGPFYAKKIIEHREALGGFVKKEQLLDLWKFDLDKYADVKNYIDVHGDVNQISINNATIEELAGHPYISYNVANSIVKMRSQKGGYISVIEVTESKLIDELLFEKVKPYLSL